MNENSSNAVKIDLNNPVFQQHLVALNRSEAQRVLDTLRKLLQMD